MVLEVVVVEEDPAQEVHPALLANHQAVMVHPVLEVEGGVVADGQVTRQGLRVVRRQGALVLLVAGAPGEDEQELLKHPVTSPAVDLQLFAASLRGGVQVLADVVQVGDGDQAPAVGVPRYQRVGQNVGPHVLLGEQREADVLEELGEVPVAVLYVVLHPHQHRLVHGLFLVHVQLVRLDELQEDVGRELHQSVHVQQVGEVVHDEGLDGFPEGGEVVEIGVGQHLQVRGKNV